MAIHLPLCRFCHPGHGSLSLNHKVDIVPCGPHGLPFLYSSTALLVVVEEVVGRSYCCCAAFHSFHIQSHSFIHCLLFPKAQTINMPAYSKLTAFAALFGLFNSSLAAYTLKDDYSGSNFFGMFDFFTVGITLAIHYHTNHGRRMMTRPMATSITSHNLQHSLLD